MPHREPLEVPGTVFVGDLLQGARDLIENPDDNPEYTRGILELLHDATGSTLEELRDIMFPQPTPLVRYAIELIGGVPEDISDWQQVAEELYGELHPTEEPRGPTKGLKMLPALHIGPDGDITPEDLKRLVQVMADANAAAELRDAQLQRIETVLDKALMAVEDAQRED